MTIPEGSAVGSISIGKPLSTGDTGDVYLGRQPGLARPVAVRVLRRSRLHEPGLVERFGREASLGSRVSHPNLVQVIDYFAFREDHYLVTEYVEGLSLRTLLDRRIDIPKGIAANIALECARGLFEVHARGVVHGSLRPSHVLLSRWGDVKLKGFASARELSEAAPENPPPADAYASPEYRMGRRIGTRADVYSLGALLLELLTGKLPSQIKDLPRHRRGRALRLALACLEKKATDRPALDRVVTRLERIVADPEAVACRVEVAAWLWQERIIERDPQELQPAEPTPQTESGEDPEPAPSVEEALAEATSTPEVHVLPADIPAGIPTPDPDPERQPALPPGALRPPLALEPKSPTGAAFAKLEEPAVSPEEEPEPAQPAEPKPVPAQTRRPRPDFWSRVPVGKIGAATALAAGVALAVLLGSSLWPAWNDPESSAPLATPANPAAPVAAGGTDTPGLQPDTRARITFAADPWARVEIDGEISFVTPRAAPVELEPGEHVVVFSHPALGEAQHRIVVEAGERRIVRQRYDGGDR